MNQHTFAFDSPKKRLSILNSTACSPPSAMVDIPPSFSNLKPNCKLISMKSRQFGTADKHFINKTSVKMLRDGIIEEQQVSLSSSNFNR